ncbi:DUF7507 domain-containing protein [Actinoplanes subglobosus]|uniref:DUF11 domain-containing protein n=1 Tax=Actinoplanes subglobosus TaxID=1547892 RepID=A0ABV8JCK3_9ACTN
MFSRKVTAAALAVGAGLASLALGSPAHAEEAQPDIRTSLAFSRDIAAVGDALTLTVTVTNDGDAAATDVAIRREFDEELTWTSPALIGGPKFDLAPGESKVLTRDGVVPQPALANGSVQVLYYFAGANGDKNTGNNIAYRSIRVPGQLGDYTVKAVDAKSGAPVAGLGVTLTERTNTPDPIVLRATSSAAGRAEFKAVQVGRYKSALTAPAGWDIVERGYSEFSISAKPGDFTVKLERNGEPTAAPSATVSASAGASASASAAAPSPSASSDAPGGEGGGLPITGSNGTLIAGAGIGLLIAGGVIFLVARQRRTRFTS